MLRGAVASIWTPKVRKIMVPRAQRLLFYMVQAKIRLHKLSHQRLTELDICTFKLCSAYGRLQAFR